MTYRRYAWVEVDLRAVVSNIRTLKALTPVGTAFMAVVKADGYGHGAVAVARAALDAGADWLGVATAEEALALRDAGVSGPLLILSEPPVEAAELLIEARVTPTLTSRAFISALSDAATRVGRVVPSHLKIDTGMNRTGVRAEDVADLVAWLRGVPGIALEGAFTHFATADAIGDWEFDRQVTRFAEALDALRTEGVRPRLAHAANSAATILHPETHLDLVRCGIGMYGLHPAKTTHGRVDLVPAMSVKARVSLVKRIGLGEGVSYGFTWHAPAATTVATLPIGYADGIHRVLSNQMDVLIGGLRCRQIGRVAMDQLMVEVPAGLEVRAGDEAVLVGEQGGQRIIMDELAETAGTITYEIACGFALRMDRRYTAP